MLMKSAITTSGNLFIESLKQQELSTVQAVFKFIGVFFLLLNSYQSKKYWI